MAINAPIQGCQADMIKIAMKEIDTWIKNEGKAEEARMILQVHDELVFEVKDSLVEELGKKFKDIMEKVLPESETKGVPIIAEANVGKNWGDMKKL